MAKALMIQGTMSGVGKSLLTAALCRIFRQDGHTVAPFKSQNMALNSYVTPDGLEIGRAQALQAEAAGVQPCAEMNPILLKPTSDAGSQVIVNGKERGNMRAAEYFRRKRELIPEIQQAYRKLSAQYDIVVIEGAGSPVELNLWQDDIVNMGLAEMLRVPVLLAGDIDRGGIFAQLLGTLSLLEPPERALVRGLIVNRFRGDASLFRDGISILQERSGLPVLGVVPYIAHTLEDEDSLSERLDTTGKTGIVDIAVIRLPRISNFTDFDVFAQYPGVSVRYVRRAEQLGNPDLLILPGTKNTLEDLQWLRETGMERVIAAYVKRGNPLFGICGGFQMLGTEVSDPLCTETGGSAAGLSLLPCRTVFQAEKARRRVTGRIQAETGFFACLNGAPFTGYELHMGQTETACPALTDIGGGVQGNVAGCYVHGIFDSAAVSGRLTEALFAARGLEYRQRAVSRAQSRAQQLDRLAETVRAHLDMSAVYRIMEEGV